MIKVFGLLLFFNALLIYLHYQDANNVTAGNTENITYNQEIEVIHRPDELYIRHHFTNLPGTRLEIVWPEASESRLCLPATEDACSRLDEHVTAFVEGEAANQSISYVIPKEGGMGDAKLFEEIFAKLYKAHADAIVLHITDEMHLGGEWVTGLPKLGGKSTKLIDYSLFTGTGTVTDLYWQKSQQPILYASDKLTVYDSNTQDCTKELGKAETMLGLIDAPHSVIVINDSGSIATNRFLITDQQKLENAWHELILKQFYLAYETSLEDEFTVEVATSLVIQEAIGSSYSQEAFKTLQKYLTATEIEQLSEAILQKRGQALNATVMDHLIEETTGYRTSFFTKNSQSANKPYPFLMESPQDIIVVGANKLDKHAIVKENRIYYPITEVMKNLGYEITSNENSLYIENAARKYRFPMRDYFYVYNEKRYNITSIPFEQIEEEFYFEESAMIRIFQLEIEKTSKTIEIAPIVIRSEGKS